MAQCIARSGLYFSSELAAVPCSGILLRMPLFWEAHISGDRDGYICEEHRNLYEKFGPPRGYLRDNLHKFAESK